ncbi:MAG: ATP-dependent helicase UvrD/PcrA [Methanolobus sp.]|jgi:DNA helicase-2/ATP-dependent DNA helicase PcrA|nr:ATP-dependent helicase UvrD/PcrA [Methanolobus sp.]
MDKILEGLNERQIKATTYNKGNLLVLAGPGSGKTTVLSRRISYLLDKSKGENYKILALTFTNKAANEMRERIEKLVGDESKRVFVGTFHSFCYELLRSYGNHIEIPNNFVIYDSPQDYIQVLTDGIRERINEELRNEKDTILSQHYTNKAIIDETASSYYYKIQKIKNKLTYSDNIESILNKQPKDFKLIYNIYETELKKYSLLDFQDLLYYSNKLLIEKPFILKQVQRIYKHILVDEGQDTNRSQFELISTICGNDFENIFIVADEDQLIFEWNDARFEYLISLVKKYRAKTIQLYENYRSPSQVLKAANNLIKYNHIRVKQKKEIIPKIIGDSECIEINAFENQDIEALFVCDRIQKLNEYNDTCVISRNKYVLDKIRSCLDELSIPFNIPMGQDRFLTREMNFIIDFLRLVFNENDKVRLYHVCGYLYADYEMIMEKDTEKTLLDNFIDIYGDQFSDLCDAINGFKGEKNAFFKYYKQLKEIIMGDSLEDDDILADIDLFEGIYNHYKIDRADEIAELGDFLNYISFTPKNSKKKGVTLLTGHASKGLEYPYVFLISMNQGIFPDYRAIRDHRALEEERRNCYVSITRTKKRLFISYTHIKQTSYGSRKNEPSQFLQEMGVLNNK